MSRVIWTDAEVEILEKMYSTSTPEELSAALPRFTAKNIWGKANSLGILKSDIYYEKIGMEPREFRRWKKEELAFLKGNYPIHGNAFCAEKLGRSSDSIQLKAHRMGLQPPAIEDYNYFTPEEDALILAEKSIKRLSKHLGRSMTIIRYRKDILQTGRDETFRSHTWSSIEIEYLLSRQHLSRDYLSKVLRRSKAAIDMKLAQLKKQRTRK